MRSESCRNYKNFRAQFPENFRCSLRFTKVRFSSHLKSENFRFPFSTKNNLTWGAECEKFISENRKGLTG